MSEVKRYYAFEDYIGNVSEIPKGKHPEIIVIAADHDLAMRKKDKEIELLREQRNAEFNMYAENLISTLHLDKLGQEIELALKDIK